MIEIHNLTWYNIDTKSFLLYELNKIYPNYSKKAGNIREILNFLLKRNGNLLFAWYIYTVPRQDHHAKSWESISNNENKDEESKNKGI